MVKVKTAEKAGVCFGVQRALELLENAVQKGKEENKRVVMLGPLIHNPRLIESYAEIGVDVVSIESVQEECIVVIRSHGVTEEEEIYLRSLKNVEIIDTTCPFVKKIHNLVAKKSDEKYGVIVFGDELHSEVTGIISRIHADYEDYLVIPPGNFEILDDFPENHEKIFLVAQTTQRNEIFLELKSLLERKMKGKLFEYKNTICDATMHRQEAAAALAKDVDAMIVIGGRNSSNTSKLFKIVSRINRNAFWVESMADFSMEEIEILRSFESVGITAGASTPDSQLDELKKFLGRELV